MGKLCKTGIMDTSNYDRDHPLYSNRNKGVPGIYILHTYERFWVIRARAPFLHAGRFKDELNGEKRVAGSISLRSKCYCLQCVRNVFHENLLKSRISRKRKLGKDIGSDSAALRAYRARFEKSATKDENINRCKSIQTRVVRGLPFSFYHNILHRGAKETVTQHSIRSRDFGLATVAERRRFASAFDDKRYLLR
jgi:hypothetical protein